MTSPLSQQLARLSVVLACEPDIEGAKLLRHLQRTRADVRHVWPVPASLGENADLVLVEYSRGLSGKFAWVPGEASAALVILVPQAGQFHLEELRKGLPDAVLHRPYQPHAIDAALMLALDHFSYGKRQRLRIARLDENIKALRDIEKAKHFIMIRKSLGENEAYRVLRDMAMERRVTIAELAAKLVDSSDVLT
ncbi:MAG: ANTAR domain-containing protein [Alphaproteobacteria bacterium]|nr:ANTAR domain-containing protein [Alphaproteobacteria bacterium]